MRPGILAGLLGVGAQPLPSGYNIIIAAGQSNMVGAAASNGADTTADALLKQFGTARGLGSYGAIVSGEDPVTLPTGGTNSTGTSTATQFARAYIAATGKKVLLVHVAFANTDLIGTIKAWQYTASPGTPAVTGNSVNVSASNLYANMIYEANRAVSAAVAADSASAIVGLIWVQGENDSNQNIDAITYQAALSALIDGFRSQVTGAANSWTVLGSMLPEAIYDEPLTYGNYPRFRQIHRAHKLLGATKPRTAFVRGSKGYSGRAADISGGQTGAIHYRDRLGLVDLGQRMATVGRPAANARVSGASVAAPGAPSIRSITATSGQSLRIEVDRDWSQGNTDLAVQYRVTGSGSWNTYYAGTLGVLATAEMITVGGLTASTQYDVQVADINAIGQSAWSATAQVTTTTTAAGYDFEGDSAGAAPAGITMMTGRLQVIAGGTSTQGTVYGQSLAVSGASSGSTWDGWLDKIPLSADRTVVFRLIKDNATNSGRVSLILRAQPDSPNGSAFVGEMRGYRFLVDYTSVRLAIQNNGDGATPTDLITQVFHSAFAVRWYRCSAIGNQLKFDESTDGTTWTNFYTVTDSTFAAGGVQLNILQSGTPSQMYVDSVSWS